MTSGSPGPSGTSSSEPSSIKNVWKFIEEKLGDDDSVPKMVFSVIGDSESFVPKPWPKSIFQSALITAAKNAGDCWIFYEGRHFGVSAVVYEALQEYERLEFFDHKGKELIPKGKEDPNAKTTIAPIIKLFGLKPKEKKNEIQQIDSETPQMDSKFFNSLLINYGDEGYEEKHLQFMVDLEKKISKQYRSFFRGFDMRIPVLMIVVEGDLQTIKRVAKATEVHLPILVIKGTGKAADLIVECIECGDDENELERIIRKRAPVLFGTSFDHENVKVLKEAIKAIKTKDWLINLYNIDEDDPTKMCEIAGEAVTRAWANETASDDHNINVSYTFTPEDTPTADTPKNEHKASELSSIKEEDYTVNVDQNFVEDLDNVPPPAQYVSKDTGMKSVTKTVAGSDQRNMQNGIINGNKKRLSRHESVTSSVTKSGEFHSFSKPDDPTQMISSGTNTGNTKEHTDNEKSRRYVLTSEFSSPASLPLYFYFAYQMLQEKPQDNSDEAHVINVNEKTLLLEALKANRTDYVQVLLDQGYSFDESQFPSLYQTTVKCENCELKDDEKCLHIQWILKETNKEVAKRLIESPKSTKVTKSARILCSELLGYSYQKSDKKESQNDTVVEIKSKKSKLIEDLLLWSIYANRPEIAEILWQKTENHLLSGTLCAVLLNRLSEEASDVKEQHLAESLKKHSKDVKTIYLQFGSATRTYTFRITISPGQTYPQCLRLFEKRCLTMVDKMYEFDPKVAMKIFKGVAEVWDITTSPMEFAYENYMYDLIAHTCCQKLLNRIWYNKLAPNFWPFLKSVVKEPGKCVTAPFARFLLHYIFFTSMLIAYSSYVMTSIDEINYTRIIARAWEYYTYFWALGDFFEEVKSGLGIFKPGDNSHTGFWSRLKRYLYDFWNLVDILSYMLLITALFVRHFHQSDDYQAARRLFSLSLLFMYLRFLQIFLISRRLGPTLIMIKEMVKDLMYFLMIAIVVVIGIGVYYHANLFPNHLSVFGPGTIETWSFWKVFYYPYFQLYGELFNDYFEVTPLTKLCPTQRSYGGSRDIR